MKWPGLLIAITALALFVWIRRMRRSGITGEQSRNRHFQGLARQLNLPFVTDGYFTQLEGVFRNHRVILYPHNFEGPGYVTLLYMETEVTATDRNWIEPDLSLGRAMVERKRASQYAFEITGKELNRRGILAALDAVKTKYAYVAITLPWRFTYSPLLQKTISQWKNYCVFLAVDAGRSPSVRYLQQVIQDACGIADAVHHSVTVSDSTG
jgi:hypothetical protein